MKKIFFLFAAVLLTSCASSERMMRLGASPDRYNAPSASRIAGVPYNAPALGMNDDFVNLWPFFVASGAYTSVLWPIIDFDNYGMAVRPFFNKEGSEYSILFPAAAWNPVNGDGWVLNTYWNDRAYGSFPFFRISRSTSHVLPVWWEARNGGDWGVFPLMWMYPEDKRYVALPFWCDDGDWGVFPLLWMYPAKRYIAAPFWYSRGDWGVFPILWMFPGNETYVMPPAWADFEESSYGLFPLVIWNRDGLKSFGPFWTWNNDYGIFPIASYFKDDYSYFFPLFYRDSDTFLTLLCGSYKKENVHDAKSEFNSRYKNYGLPFSYRGIRAQRNRESWMWIPPYCGGATEYSVVPEDTDFENIKAVSDLKDAKDETYRWFGVYPLFEYSSFMDAHEFDLGLFLAGWESSPHKELFHILGSLGFKYNKVITSRQTSENTDILFDILYSSEKKERADVIDPYRTQESLIEPFGSNIYCSESIERSALLSAFICDSMKITMWRADAPAEAEKFYEVYNKSLYYSEEAMCVETPLEAVKQALDEMNAASKSLGVDFAVTGKASAKNALDIIKAKYSEEKTVTQSGFLHKLGYRYVNCCSDSNLWVGAGAIARQKILGADEETRILGFLYRYSRRGDDYFEMIFPFVTRKRSGAESSFSFMWRLLNIERINGELTGGHIFFIPFSK